MTGSTLSRRGFLGLAAAATAVPLLAACNVSGSSNTGGSSGDASGELKFWDMPWGTPEYNELGKKTVDGYAPAEGLGKASYQTIQWNGFYQTFSSAIASKTGPAVSSGAGFQAFQFADQGAIAYADNLIETLKSDGTYDDFLPGVVDTMKTDKGYVAVPWQTDVRPFWYNKAVLEEAGAKVPTTWDELLTAGQALKKNRRLRLRHRLRRRQQLRRSGDGGHDDQQRRRFVRRRRQARLRDRRQHRGDGVRQAARATRASSTRARCRTPPRTSTRSGTPRRLPSACTRRAWLIGPRRWPTTWSSRHR